MINSHPIISSFPFGVPRGDGLAANIWDLINHFKFARLKFNLMAIDFLPLPDYWGLVFENALRHSLRKATCSHRDSECKDCENREG